MPKRTTPAAPRTAPVITLSFNALMQAAQAATAASPADDYVGRSMRTRHFAARLIDALPDTEADALAIALQMPCLTSRPIEVPA